MPDPQADTRDGHNPFKASGVFSATSSAAPRYRILATAAPDQATGARQGEAGRNEQSDARDRLL